MEAEFMRESVHGHEDLWRPVIRQLLPLSNNNNKQAVAIYLDGVLVDPRPQSYR